MEQEKPVSGQLAQADLHVKEREGSLIIEGIQCKKKNLKLKKVQNDYSFKHDMRNTASSSSRESVIILSCDI